MAGDFERECPECPPAAPPGAIHRGGYAPTAEARLAKVEHWARRGGTLQTGEGAVLCAEIDRLRSRVHELEARAEGLWTTADVAAFARRAARTVRRWGIPKVGKGLYDPAVVKAWLAAGHHLAGGQP